MSYENVKTVKIRNRDKDMCEIITFTSFFFCASFFVNFSAQLSITLVIMYCAILIYVTILQFY